MNELEINLQRYKAMRKSLADEIGDGEYSELLDVADWVISVLENGMRLVVADLTQVVLAHRECDAKKINLLLNQLSAKLVSQNLTVH